MIARGVNPRLIAQPFVSVAKRRGSALEFGRLQGAVARNSLPSRLSDKFDPLRC